MKPDVMTCETCGSPLRDADRFCATCGNEVREPAADACSACGAPMAPDDRFCGECGTPALPPVAGPRPPIPAPASTESPPSVPTANAPPRQGLPAAGWVLILYTAFMAYDLLRAFGSGAWWPQDDPIIAPLAAGFMLAIPLNVILWLAVIGLLSRARWAFGLAVLGMIGSVALRGLVFVWLVLTIQFHFGDDAISDVLNELLSFMYWVWGLAEILVLTGLLLSRKAFRQRVS